ncbi:MAG TPA: acetyl-CoA carboxylase biotin carboxyl carrier protein [Bryobacteraceae bacterium]|jgi:acetyl-CoA carboxylase biotin carboxyl carrier protein|nr:acetyl-CoA carboxylase biotin carboxyl carrier protein [Bryobacteraceae bacterium]
MTIEEIKELLAIFNESGVAELELQRGENRLRIRRAGMTTDYAVPAAASAAPAPVASAPPSNAPSAPAAYPQTPPASPAASGKPSDAADPNQVLVRSPIVGTYYEAAAPGAPPFVRVGDAVEPGQVLCIIESMKLMNEIEAEVAGIITAKLVENGRPVEYGEALFSIRPR